MTTIENITDDESEAIDAAKTELELAEQSESETTPGFVEADREHVYQMAPDFFPTDVDPSVAEAALDAVATLAKYVNPEDLTPIFAEGGSLTDVVLRFAEANHVTEELALRKVQRGLKDRCEAEMTRLGRVSLDINGDGFEFDKDGDVTYHRLWGVLGHGQVCFTALRTTSQNFVEGEREAMAVYYTPPIAKDESRRRFKTRTKGDRIGERFEVSDDYYVGGYLGTVAWFADMASAEEAMHELRRAITTIATTASGTALRDDPVRTVGVSQERELPDAY
jgi:hypothetical protein